MALGNENNKENLERANELFRIFESGGKRPNDKETGLTKPSKCNGSMPFS